MSPYRAPLQFPSRVIPVGASRFPVTVAAALLAVAMLVGGLLSVLRNTTASVASVTGICLFALASMILRSTVRHARTRTWLRVTGNEVTFSSSGSEAPASFACKLDEMVDVVVESTSFRGAESTLALSRLVLVGRNGRFPLELSSPGTPEEDRVRVEAIRTFLALPMTEPFEQVSSNEVAEPPWLSDADSDGPDVATRTARA